MYALILLAFCAIGPFTLQAVPIAIRARNPGGVIMNNVGDPCTPQPLLPTDNVCNPLNLTCLAVKTPPIRPGGSPFGEGHGPVNGPEASANSPELPDAPDILIIGQCVIKRALHGEACGTFVKPAVLCADSNLTCAFDLSYPPLNAKGVTYANLTDSNAMYFNTSTPANVTSDSRLGACVPVLGINSSCPLNSTSILYPPRCDVGLVCVNNETHGDTRKNIGTCQIAVSFMNITDANVSTIR